jgi:hypothetical protein
MSKNHKAFRTLAVAALIVGVAKCMRSRAWKMGGGPQGEAFAQHWRKFHERRSWWFKDWDEPTVEETEQAEVTADTAAAQA